MRSWTKNHWTRQSGIEQSGVGSLAVRGLPRSRNPTEGREIRKTRPCLIISPDEMPDIVGNSVVALPFPRQPAARLLGFNWAMAFSPWKFALRLWLVLGHPGFNWVTALSPWNPTRR
ncbi:MAG TPA: type II toxin-antitoxin system PemK/MazF family toxin [Candidatus Binatia bacterium]|nr:type II toxin-antitoxin system PemK/MazF family toxin [Candidatus Binatia bacterium]